MKKENLNLELTNARGKTWKAMKLKKNLGKMKLGVTLCALLGFQFNGPKKLLCIYMIEIKIHSLK